MLSLLDSDNHDTRQFQIGERIRLTNNKVRDFCQLADV